MPPHKRQRLQSYLEAIEDDDNVDIQVLLTEGQPIPAHRSVLSISCSCAAGLPPDSKSWDLKDLLIDGEPVTRDVVLTWLEIIYGSVGFCRSPTFSDKLDRSRQLLLFADAVGTNQQILEGVAEKLDQPSLNFKISWVNTQPEDDEQAGAADGPEDAQEGMHSSWYIELDAIYVLDNKGQRNEAIVEILEHSVNADNLGSCVINAPSSAVLKAFAQRLEDYMHLVNRIPGLLVVAKRFHKFLQNQSIQGRRSIMSGPGCLTTVYSKRVLEVLNRDILLEAYFLNVMAPPVEHFTMDEVVKIPSLTPTSVAMAAALGVTPNQGIKAGLSQGLLQPAQGSGGRNCHVICVPAIKSISTIHRLAEHLMKQA